MVGGVDGRCIGPRAGSGGGRLRGATRGSLKLVPELESEFVREGCIGGEGGRERGGGGGGGLLEMGYNMYVDNMGLRAMRLTLFECEGSNPGKNMKR